MSQPTEQTPEPEIPSSNSSRYPSRQKKLGPAPFASFEDLSDDVCPSVQSEPGKAQQRMPEIQEDEARSPEVECHLLETGRCSIGGISAPFSPPSGPTSGLQTPSTPRIDISCASSGTPQSESSSEKELFQCTLGLAFHEDGADDLRSSTEELVESGPEDGEKSKKDKEESIRRASQPANMFHQGKISVSPDLDEQVRKLSTHSMCLDGFHSRTTRHSSFGAADSPRPGAHSSLSAHSNVSGRRSSSPHKMLYETSFCGNKPIPTPSMDLGDSPPASAASGSGGCPQNDGNCRGSGNGLKQHSDSSLSQTMEMLTETIQVHCARTSRGSSPPDSPAPTTPSIYRTDHHPTATTTATASTSTKLPPASPREIISPPVKETKEKAITANKSKSSSIESETGRAQKSTSTSTNDLRAEKVSSEKLIDSSSSRPSEKGNDGESTPIETKGLFLQESQDQDDDGDLPYVPTTLPLEKSSVASMVPVKQRRFDFSSTNPIQRPRCTNPPKTASISDYIVHTTVHQDRNCEDKKMKINLPREDSGPEIDSKVNNPKSPKKKGGPTSWTDFAEMGLRSPREIRRKMKEDNGTTRDLCSYQSDPSEGSGSTGGVNNWSDGDTESLQTA